MVGGESTREIASGAHAEYATFVTEDFLPVVDRLLGERPLPESFALPTSKLLVDWRTGVESLVIGLAAGLSILPLGSPEFMATLKQTQVQALLPKWQELTPRSALPIEVVVMAMRERLGDVDASDWAPTERPTLLKQDVQLRTPLDVDRLIQELFVFSRIVPSP